MKVSDQGSTSRFKGSTQRFQIQVEHKGSKVSENSIFRHLKVPPDVFKAPDRGSK